MSKIYFSRFFFWFRGEICPGHSLDRFLDIQPITILHTCTLLHSVPVRTVRRIVTLPALFVLSSTALLLLESVRDRDRPPVLGNHHLRPWTAANWMLSSLSCMDVFSPPLCSCLSTFPSSLPLIPVLLWPTDVGRKQALFEVEARGGLGNTGRCCSAGHFNSSHFWIIPTETFKVHRNDPFSNTFCQTHLYTFLNEQGVFTEDPRPEDPGPVRVRVYILNGQPGPGRVPIYYFGSRVCLTLCVIPESIGEHRTCQWSVSVGTLCVFCNLQLVKLGWEKYERE